MVAEAPVDDIATIRLLDKTVGRRLSSGLSTRGDSNLAMDQGITHAADADAEVTPTLDPQPGYCCVVFKPSQPTA